MKFQENILNSFKSFEDKLNGQKSSELHKIRRQAIENFQQNGVPTVRHEDWKYSNVMFLNKYSFDLNESSNNVTHELIEKKSIPGTSDNRVVFINGHYSENFSNYDDSSIILKPLKKAFLEDTTELTNYFGRLVNTESHPFAAVNTALAMDGLLLKVEKNKAFDKPIELLNIVDSTDYSIQSNIRNIVVAEEGSKGSLLIKNITIGDNQSLFNTTNEIFVAKNAKFELFNIQNDKNNSNVINLTEAQQDRDSEFTDHTITLNGGFIRNDLRTKLAGENSVSNYNGLYLLNDRQHADNHTFVDHAVAHCNSNEYYKGILDDKAKGVFNGKVLVRQDAQKTDAYQQNRNLILSDLASMNSKPELEIYADDVKCSHGATTGKIDETALFYMRQRGLPEAKARALMQYVFAMEVVNKINNDQIKDHFGKLILDKLGIDI